jgi:hypothetical protein
MLLHLDQQMASVKAEVQRSLPAQLQAASAAQGPGVPAASVHSSSPPAAVRLRSQSGRFTKQVRQSSGSIVPTYSSIQASLSVGALLWWCLLVPHRPFTKLSFWVKQSQKAAVQQVHKTAR